MCQWWNAEFHHFPTLIWWYLKNLLSLSKLGQSVWLNCPIFGLTRLLLVLAVQDQVWREKLNLLREKLNLLQENCPFVSLTKASPDWPSPDQGRSPKCFLNWQVWKLRQVSKTCDTVGTKWVKIFLETWQKKFDKPAILLAQGRLLLRHLVDVRIVRFGKKMLPFCVKNDRPGDDGTLRSV